MKGIIPSARIDARSKAPPLNMLNMATMVPCCCAITSANTAASIPGIGTKEAARNTMIAPSTNNKRDLSSDSPPFALDFSNPGLAMGQLSFDFSAGRFDSFARAVGDFNALHGNRTIDFARLNNFNEQNVLRY